MWEFFNFYFMPGIVLGCVYALGAIGISLTFGILRFANFAHGEMMMLGAYFTFSFITFLEWHPIVAALPSMVICAMIMLGLDRAFFMPFRKSPTIMLVIASFGLMLMIRSAIQFFWGVQSEQLVAGIQRPLNLFSGAVLLPPKHFWIIGTTLVLMFSVWYLLTFTRIGKAMRAVSDSPELAQLTGIDVELVIRWTWIVGTVTAVAAGVLFAMDTQLTHRMGTNMLLPMFAAAILGGIGRPFGAVAGGLIIGMVEELSSYPWIGTTPLVSPSYKTGIAFAIMVAMLILRPSGLFRGRTF